MKTNLLVTAQQVKDNSIIEGSVEDIRLRPAIQDAGSRHLLAILGEDMHGLVYASRTTGGAWTGLTAWQTAFVDDHVTPYLIARSAANYVAAFGLSISNAGINRIAGSNTEPADVQSIKPLRDHLEGQADFYGARLTAHLRCQQRGVDPWIDAYLGTDQNPLPDRTNSGMSLPIYFPSC